MAGLFNIALDKRKVMKKVNSLVSVYRFVTLLCIGYILLYPIFIMLSVAFRPSEQLSDPYIVWIPKSLTLHNFIVAWDGLDFTKSGWNSFYITIISTILQVVSCSMAGYGFARFKFKGRELLFALALFTILVPPDTINIPKYMQFWRFDFFGVGKLIDLFTGKSTIISLIQTPWTLFIPAALGNGIRGGLFIYIFRQFFRGMPKELEDAAYIDGCSPFQTFIKVMIPGASVAIVTVTIFSVVWYWNEYLSTAFFMSNVPIVSTKLMSIRSTFYYYAQIGKMNELWSPAAVSAAVQAGCLMVTLPILIMYSLLQKHFTESIERTGIVG